MTRYGRIPDPYDPDDHHYTLPKFVKPLPASIDLRGQCEPDRDQGNVGACTAFATTGMLWYDRHRQGEPDFAYSELFLYYNSRADKKADTGTTIRNSIKAALRVGVCNEELWPYNEDHEFLHPAPGCYQDALLHRGVEYQRVPQDLLHMQSVLAGGNVLVVGFTVFSSFESSTVATTGIVPMPARGEQELGGHAVLLVGYDDARQVFTCQNSWGATWGDKGFFYIPYQYLLNSKLSSDFWVIQKVQ